MSNYVMFGYCMSDIDQTAFLAKIPTSKADDKEACLTQETHEAKKFPSENTKNIKGFGTPVQWLKLVNDEFVDIYGKDAYKFHLVKTAL